MIKCSVKKGKFVPPACNCDQSTWLKLWNPDCMIQRLGKLKEKSKHFV